MPPRSRSPTVQTETLPELGVSASRAPQPSGRCRRPTDVRKVVQKYWDPLLDLQPGALRRILVAVAWPYASGPRHLGHVAGFGVPSDIFARFHRLKRNRVLMISGTDEHGTPITVAADDEGITPKALADRNNAAIAQDLRALGLSYDLFTRTTTQNHYHTVQEVFNVLLAKGYLVQRETVGAFDPLTGRTLPDRYIEGTCPNCGYESARGDQCDSCGRQLDPEELIAPRSRIDGATPVFRSTLHYFLALPAFEDELRRWISSQHHWRPNVRSFSLNLLGDLRPRPITRDLDWGVPIPLPEFETGTKKRIYVWFDAVIGYLSASMEWAKLRGAPDAWRDWWQDDSAHHYYFMGKDNIVFHTIVWPAMLLGLGADAAIHAGRRQFNLPYDVVSSEFLTMESRRFSTSRGTGILVRDFLERYDADALRYYLTIAGPESADTDFTWAEFVRRNNDELVANWGNLVHRSLSTTFRNFGEVPKAARLEEADARVLHDVYQGYSTVGALIESARFRAALAEAMRLAATVNRYLGEQEPWKFVTHDRERAGTILNTALQCIENLKTLLTPFIPASCQRLHAMLGNGGTIIGTITLKENSVDPADAHRVLTIDPAELAGEWAPKILPTGQALRKPTTLFTKLGPEVIEEELARMTSAANVPSP